MSDGPFQPPDGKPQPLFFIFHFEYLMLSFISHNKFLIEHCPFPPDHKQTDRQRHSVIIWPDPSGQTKLLIKYFILFQCAWLLIMYTKLSISYYYQPNPRPCPLSQTPLIITDRAALMLMTHRPSGDIWPEITVWQMLQVELRHQANIHVFFLWIINESITRKF